MSTEIVEQENRRLRCPYLVRVKTVKQVSGFDKFMTISFGVLLVIFDFIWLSSAISSIIMFPLVGCELFLSLLILFIFPIGLSIFALSVVYEELKTGENS